MTGKDKTDGTEQQHRRRLHDEGMLSGYLDGELTQAEEQFVELRLEASEELRRELAGLKRLRETTMDMKKMLEDFDAAYNDAFNRGDAAGCAAFFTEDVVLMPPANP